MLVAITFGKVGGQKIDILLLVVLFCEYLVFILVLKIL